MIIAEPLVLRVFQTGIVDHVQQQRQNAIDNLRTALVDCNPVPGITVPNPSRNSCAGMTLNISNPAAASLAKLDSLQRQSSGLQTQVNIETRQLTRLQNIVNDECNGRHGPGFTGLLGNGPACKQDQQAVIEYRASHPMSAQNRQLSSLNEQIRSLQSSLADQQASYREAISKAISTRLKKETPPSAPIGMAERFQALSYLSLTNGFIGVASWLVRLFFILIDCLPVLVKFISGSTPYDRLVDIEIASAEKRFGRSTDTADVVADEENATVLWQAKAEAARRRKEIDLEILRQEAERGSIKDNAVDELWRKKLDARRSAAAGTTGLKVRAAWPSSPSCNEEDGSHLNGSTSTVIDDTTEWPAGPPSELGP